MRPTVYFVNPISHIENTRSITGLYDGVGIVRRGLYIVYFMDKIFSILLLEINHPNGKSAFGETIMV